MHAHQHVRRGQLTELDLFDLERPADFVQYCRFESQDFPLTAFTTEDTEVHRGTQRKTEKKPAARPLRCHLCAELSPQNGFAGFLCVPLCPLWLLRFIGCPPDQRSRYFGALSVPRYRIASAASVMRLCCFTASGSRSPAGAAPDRSDDSCRPRAPAPHCRADRRPARRGGHIADGKAQATVVGVVGIGAVHDAHVMQRERTGLQRMFTTLLSSTSTMTSCPRVSRLLAANVSWCGSWSIRWVPAPRAYSR